MEYEKLDINDVEPNEYNPNKLKRKGFEHLKKEIKRIGFLQPILVNQDNKIIDGEHRWKACKEIGKNKIPVIKTDMDEEEAKVTTINMNKIKGMMETEKYHSLIQGLLEDFGKGELGELLMEDEDDIDIIAELEEDDFDDEEIKQFVNDKATSKTEQSIKKSKQADKGELPNIDLEGKEEGIRYPLTFWFEEEQTKEEIKELFYTDEKGWEELKEPNTYILKEAIKKYREDNPIEED